MDSKPTTQRLYSLDWLRVLAVLAVFFFHSSRFFTEPPWHISNAQLSEEAQILSIFVSQWGMPLIFVISGASIALALRPGRAVKFLTDKVLRLLVPLIFGIIVLAPPQRYLERLTHKQFQGSFLEFLPHAYDSANFDWMGIHLYYLAALFLYSLFLLPLFAALQTARGLRLVQALAGLSTKPGVLLLWSAPIALALMALDPASGPGLRDHGGWSLFVYPFFLFNGYLLFAVRAGWQAVVRQRWLFLALGLVLTIVLGIVMSSNDVDILGYGTSQFLLLMALDGLYSWTLILVILGFGMRHLDIKHPAVAYANEAVLPFYMLHQPVILAVGYLVIPTALSILAKYLIIAPVSLALSIALYEFVIRRVGILRPFFGLKPARAPGPDAGGAKRPAPQAT